MTTPPVTSLWPFRYLVALCIARSTPSASGCWLIGLAKVLSITDSDAARAAGLGDPPDVDAAQRRVDRRLEPDQPGAVGDDALEAGELVERDEPRRDAEARKQIVQQVQRAAVDRRAADAPRRPLSSMRHQDRRRRAHAGREQQRRLGAIERRQLRFDARPPSGWCSASRGTCRTALRCTRPLPPRCRTRRSSSRRSASSTARRRRARPRRRESARLLRPSPLRQSSHVSHPWRP